MTTAATETRGRSLQNSICAERQPIVGRDVAAWQVSPILSRAVRDPRRCVSTRKAVKLPGIVDEVVQPGDICGEKYGQRTLTISSPAGEMIRMVCASFPEDFSAERWLASEGFPWRRREAYRSGRRHKIAWRTGGASPVRLAGALSQIREFRAAAACLQRRRVAYIYRAGRGRKIPITVGLGLSSRRHSVRMDKLPGTAGRPTTAVREYMKACRLRALLTMKEACHLAGVAWGSVIAELPGRGKIRKSHLRDTSKQPGLFVEPAERSTESNKCRR